MIYFCKRIVAVVFAAVMLASCAATSEKIVEEGGAQLSGAEIQELYGAGFNMAWTSASGTSGTAVYAPDGAANVSFGSNNWVGKWRVEGETFCAAYPERDNGAERCFSLFRRASGGYSWFNTDGSHGGDFTIVN